jgi:hypothetical protein
MIVKTEDNDFNRDQSNFALINTNIEAYKLYRRQRAYGAETTNLQHQVDALKSDIADIKDMLKVLIQRENNGDNNI